jgi:hypothetical protein
LWLGPVDSSYSRSKQIIERLETMKKTSKQPSRTRKLVVSRESVALLTAPQLTQVAGGAADSGWPPSCITEQPHP